MTKINIEQVRQGDRLTVTIGASTLVGTAQSPFNGYEFGLNPDGWENEGGYPFTIYVIPRDNATIEREVETFTERFAASPVGTVAIYAPNGVIASHGYYLKKESGVFDIQQARIIGPNINSALAADKFAWAYPKTED